MVLINQRRINDCPFLERNRSRNRETGLDNDI